MKNSNNDAYPAESSLSKSPALIFFSIALTVFVSEAAVMLLLHLLPPESWLGEAFMDATVLVLLISPALYFFLFRPMVAHIRERGRIEAKLHKNEEEQFKIMIRASLDGFWITDMRGHFIEVNDAYCKMMGYSQKELLSMGVTDVEAMETHEDTERHIRRVIETGSDCFETRHRRLDGRILDIEASINYSDFHGGRFYCFLRDISERKQAEQELRDAKEAADEALQKLHESTQSLRVLSRAIEQSPVMNVITDINGTIQYVNPKFYQLTGYTAAEVIGENPRILNAGVQTDEFYAELWQTITSGQEWHGEMCNQKKNGELYWEYASISPVRNEKGEITQFIASKEDITKRKLAEEELKLSAQILNSISDTVFLLDLDGNFIYLNEAAWKTRGYTQDEMMGMNLRTLNAPKQNELFASRMTELMANGQGSFESEHRRRDGSFMPVEIHARIIESGGRLLLLSVIRDITERKRMQIALQENEEKFRSMSTYTQDALIMMDDEGNISFWNPAAEKIFGYSASEVMDKELHTFIAPDRYYDAFKKVYEHFRETGEGGMIGKTRELMAMRKGGVEFPVELSLSALKLKDKWHGVGIVRDITERRLDEEKLRISEARLQATLDNSPYMIWQKDPDGRYIACNQIFIKASGQNQPQDVLGKTDLDLWPEELAEKYRDDDNEVIASGCQKVLEERAISNGQEYWVETCKTPIVDKNGRLLGTTGFAQDITLRKQAEVMLRESESRLRELFENLSSGVAVYQASLDGRDFCFTAFNGAAERIENMHREDLIGKNITEVFPSITEFGLLEVFRRVWQSGVAEHFPVTFYQDGRIEGWRENYVYKLPNGEIVAIYDDVTKAKQAEEKMHYLAHYDALTDLPNRTLFADRLRQSLTTAKRDKAHSALMFLDLDKFKPVNDELGHDVGDLLLKEVAIRLHNCVRESDTVSRIGGDEFVILLPVIEAEQDAMLVAEKILYALNLPFELAGNSISISASIGVAVYPEHGNDEKMLTKHADTAMYYAKKGGRNNAQLYRTDMTAE